MIHYPFEMEQDSNGTLLLTCPVLPEVTTFAIDRSEALLRAREAIEEALAARISRWQDIPAPAEDKVSQAERRDIAMLSSLASIKTQLFLACREKGVSRSELGRRLDWHREQVDRLFRFNHSTRLDQFDAAFKAIGRELHTKVVELSPFVAA